MKKLNYVIVLVSEMQRSVEFYRDVLGLPLKFESPGWSEFANDGSAIALHPGGPAEPPRPDRGRLPAGTCHLGFEVEDLDAFHQKMESRGVRCTEPPRKLDFGGRLAVYADPDGLPISVGESQKK
jgi:lactoylglutathione lyase